MRRRPYVLGALIGLVAALISPSTVFASADSSTFHFEATRSYHYAAPCPPAVGTINETFKGVTHLTSLTDGSYHETTTVIAEFTFVPDDPSQPAAYGRYTAWDGENLTSNNNYTATVAAHVTGFTTDGSRALEVVTFHVTLTPDGTVAVEFDNLRLTCP